MLLIVIQEHIIKISIIKHLVTQSDLPMIRSDSRKSGWMYILFLQNLIVTIFWIIILNSVCYCFYLY